MSVALLWQQHYNFKWIKVWTNELMTIALISLRDVIPIMLYRIWTKRRWNLDDNIVRSYNMLTRRLIKDDQLLSSSPFLLHRHIWHVLLCDSKRISDLRIAYKNTVLWQVQWKNIRRIDGDIEYENDLSFALIRAIEYILSLTNEQWTAGVYDI